MDATDVGIGAAVGAVLPLVIAVIVQWHQSEAVKAVTALVVCLAAAAVTAWFTDAIHFDDPGWDWVAWIGTVYGSAMIMYGRFWKPTKVAQRIEFATTLDTSRPRGK